MRAYAVDVPGPIATHPLVELERPLPEPGPGEVRVQVEACGVCRTDLHLAEGDLEPRRSRVVPGHEVVGVVDALGAGAGRFSLGQRVGVAWLGATCGRCHFCVAGRENLCVAPSFTGWDRDGGYSEFTLVDERFAYPIPAGLSPVAAAPLLCAGIIGYRALLRAELPPGGRLGIYGFGASAHLCAQLAIAQGARVHVLTRGAAARALALELGAASAGAADAMAPEPLDAAILFAPVGTLVPVALSALGRGGTLCIAGIHLSDVPPLNYAEHLFYEKSVRSVTANTRQDGLVFLELAARLGLRATTHAYRLAEATDALRDLSEGRFAGAAVLVADESLLAAGKGAPAPS
ncbi:MAG: zinc-dependent alcohol dehydrogenase family protein [Actinomycetota bacterium]|nr:zinc-dependent alcohol dehydrogenase family protein [Actinomycetota bacterium]